MKQFLTVFKFEFVTLVKTKAFIITTLIMVLISTVGLSLPRIFGEVNASKIGDSVVEQLTNKSDIGLYDPSGLLTKEDETLKLYFPKTKFTRVDTLDALKEGVKNDTFNSGFEVTDTFTYTYFVNDSSMTDITPNIFAQALSQVKRNAAFSEAGMDASVIMKMYYDNTATGTNVILGSDGASNLMYTIVLVMLIYMVVIMYGTIIATKVASEKGNRTMELLVTSANPNALIFGKVLAGAAAAILQIGLFIGSAMLSYKVNGALWNGLLDGMFNIPFDVLGAFAMFGVTGFIFYAFIFGALGALVSKSEDVNSSATPITIVFVIVYIIVYMGIMSPDSIIFVVASFVPFSSPMAMFARMAMVEVPLVQVLVSFAILIVSTVLVGMGAAKIYRRGTLMYGNQIKLSHALKWIKKDS